MVAVSQCAVLYSPYYGAYPYAAYPTLAKSTITYKTSGKYPSQRGWSNNDDFYIFLCQNQN